MALSALRVKDKNARYASKKDKQNIIIGLFNRGVLLHAAALRL